MIIYIRYIDPDFSRRHPVLYWIILVVSLLIFFCSILYLPYIVYARASRKKAEKRPTGHKSKQKPGGPPHNNNTDPYMQQSTNHKKKSTSKKTTSQKATEDQKKEEEKKLKKKLANAKARERLRNDRTIDENGLTRLEKEKEICKARMARYNERLRNDRTEDENGLTRLDKHKASIRKGVSKYQKTEKAKQNRKIRAILSRPTGYE